MRVSESARAPKTRRGAARRVQRRPTYVLLARCHPENSTRNNDQEEERGGDLLRSEGPLLVDITTRPVPLLQSAARVEASKRHREVLRKWGAGRGGALLVERRQQQGSARAAGERERGARSRGITTRTSTKKFFFTPVAPLIHRPLVRAPASAARCNADIFFFFFFFPNRRANPKPSRCTGYLEVVLSTQSHQRGGDSRPPTNYSERVLCVRAGHQSKKRAVDLQAYRLCLGFAGY